MSNKSQVQTQNWHVVVVNHCIGGGAGEKKEHINTDTKQRSNKSHMLKIGRWCLSVVREHSDQPQWCDHCTSGGAHKGEDHIIIRGRLLNRCCCYALSLFCAWTNTKYTNTNTHTKHTQIHTQILTQIHTQIHTQNTQNTNTQANRMGNST